MIYTKLEGFKDNYSFELTGDSVGVRVYHNSNTHFKKKINTEIPVTISSSGYCSIMMNRDDGRRTVVGIHAILMSILCDYPIIGNEYVVDHLNHSKTDNSISNLRVITNRSNVYRSSTKSLPRTKNGGYRSQIWFKEKPHGLGTYKTDLQARNAYTRMFNLLERGRDFLNQKPSLFNTDEEFLELKQALVKESKKSRSVNK